MNRVNWRALTLLSAAGTAASFAFSAFSATAGRVEVLYAVWALIGFFASTMTCLGLRVLSDLPDKERAFGVRLGVELFITATVLFALPPLVISIRKYPGAVLGVAGVVALLGISAFWVPPRPLVARVSEAPPKAALPAASWFKLLVFFLFLVRNACCRVWHSLHR
jgi:hypothetical protein